MPLSPSQRVKILTEVSKRLAAEEWPLVDLILTQFKLRTDSDWNGEKVSYVVEMAKHADDETLNGLAEHFELPAAMPGTPSVQHPSFWKEGTLKVFISHLSAHRKFTGELQEALSHYGITAFVAHKDIEPTYEWQTEIENGLATCDSLVALLHDDFHASNWTDQEIGFAMGRGIPVFAVRLGQDPYGFIGRFQAFNGSGKAPAALAIELFNAYRKNKQSQAAMQNVLISLLEKSGSFESARVRTGYLEDMTSWHPSFTGRVRAAIRDNTQVGSSWGVPGRLEALIEKMDPSARRPKARDLDDDIPF
ncbi:toll/interleukin-1 receptor domain-containing protein [uncultured Enterovirga sp.]|uniref:toll/interleukin-1 receptor domain-containing protein n=1 Tax=uncultured Enterovirga sp. TaxID=2026352 RepID=UPI0035CA84E6